MKRITASEARQNWFRVLDEVVSGEVVVIERKGHRVVLRVEPPGGRAADRSVPDYAALVRGNAEDADRWTWDWSGPEEEIEPIG